jgi:eukaryotic-like serine/threonine-protein kinase
MTQHPLPFGYALGPFTVDLRKRKLRRGDEVVALPARAFDTLVFLIAHRGRIVAKDDIITAAWHDVAVTDDSLIHAISVLRRVLGDDPGQPAFIETIPRRGYRLVALVEELKEEQPGDPVAEVIVGGEAAPAVAAEPQAWRLRDRLGVRGLTIGAAAVLAIGVMAGAAALWMRTASPESRPMTVQFRQEAPAGTALLSGGIVSPTGRHLVFVALDERSGRSRLWVRPVASTEPFVLRGTENASKPFWSPDGRRLAFFADSRLMATDLEGTAPRTIASIDGAPAGGSWSANDLILFADWTSGLYTVPAGGGPAKRITRLDHENSDFVHAWPQFLPDGRHFLYQVVTGDSARAGIYVGSIDSPRSVRLLFASSPAAYAPPGFLLYVRHDMLMAEPFDATRMGLAGRPIQLTRGVAAPSTSDEAPISGSRDLLAFRQGGDGVVLRWLDRSGSERAALELPTSLVNFRVSPDGRSLLATSSESDTSTLWTVDLRRGQLTRLHADAIGPLWAPDASRVAFTSRDGLDVHLRRTDAPPSAAPFFTSRSVKILNDWSRDGREIVYTQRDSHTRLDLWVLPISGSPRPLLQTRFSEAQARISPDGRWIAYVSDESGTHEVYVRRYPQGDQPQRVSVGGGAQPQWRADQSELFYVASDRAVMAVPVTRTPTVSFATPTMLFRTAMPIGAADIRDSFAVSADNQFLFIDHPPAAVRRPSITVMANWTAGLPSAQASVPVEGSAATVVAVR